MKNLILLTIYFIASLAFADTPRKIEAGEYFFNAPTGSNKIKLSAPALGANRSYKLPAADGSANDCLKTDGSGQMAFSPCAKVDLSNLTTTSIPVALLPNSAFSQNIGSNALPWTTGHFQDINFFSGITDPGNLTGVATGEIQNNFNLVSYMTPTAVGYLDFGQRQFGIGSGTDTFLVGTESIIFDSALSIFSSPIKLEDDTGSSTTLVPNGSGGAFNFVFPNTSGSAGDCLKTNGSGFTSWSSCSGGGGTPGGSDTQVQFNDGGAFGGDSGLIYLKANDYLGIGGSPRASNSLDVQSTASTIFTEIRSTANSSIAKLNLTAKTSGAVEKTLEIGSSPNATATSSLGYLGFSSSKYLEFFEGSTIGISDAASFGIRHSTKNVGIGIPMLEITSATANSTLNFFTAAATAEGSELNFIAANGTPTTPTATGSGKVLMDIGAWGFNGTSAVRGSLIRSNQNAAITGTTAPTEILYYVTNPSGTLRNSFTMGNNGIFYINDGHNPTGATSVTSGNPAVYSGTWTPTITNIQNVNAVNSAVGNYTRVGNIVTASIFLDLNTNTGVKKFYFTVPVSQVNFASLNELSGTLSATPDDINFYPGTLAASASSQLGHAQYPGNGSANQYAFLTFTYRVK